MRLILFGGSSGVVVAHFNTNTHYFGKLPFVIYHFVVVFGHNAWQLQLIGAAIRTAYV